MQSELSQQNPWHCVGKVQKRKSTVYIKFLGPAIEKKEKEK